MPPGHLPAGVTAVQRGAVCRRSVAAGIGGAPVPTLSEEHVHARAGPTRLVLDTVRVGAVVDVGPASKMLPRVWTGGLVLQRELSAR